MEAEPDVVIQIVNQAQ
jgi:hypothetical protein